MTAVAEEEAKRLGLDALLNVLLAVTGSLQLGALATRVAGRKRVSFTMAGMNTAMGLAFSLVMFAEFLGSHERMELRPAVLFALQGGAAVEAAIGLTKRGESGWLFWPVWLWNFVMVYQLVRLRFFFLSGWNFG